MARAQELYPVEIYKFVCMSNHAHWILGPRDAEQLASFMRHLLSNLSKEAKRRRGSREPVFDRRYQAVLISEEEAAQVARLRYLLAHGTKEGIVASPLDWPGPHSAGQLLSQESIPVEWCSRTDQRRLRNNPEALRAATHRYDFRLAPLPCWAHKSREWIRETVAEMLQEIEQEAAQQRRDSHRSTVPSRKGSAAARRRGPGRLTDLPLTPRPGPRRTPAPLVHAASQKVRRRYQRAYAAFVASMRETVEEIATNQQTRALIPVPGGAYTPSLYLRTPS